MEITISNAEGVKVGGGFDNETPVVNVGYTIRHEKEEEANQG